MIALTEMQGRCLDVIDRSIRESGHAPSFSELTTALGLRSKSGVHRLVDALEKRGRIRRIGRNARAIEVVRKFCPHCGEPIT